MSREQQILKEIEGLANELMADWPSSRNKQKQFILEYVKNNFANGTQAAKRAGYSERTARTVASNMLTGMNNYEHIPPVVEKLKQAFDEKATELSVASALEIKQYLTSVMRGEEFDETLMNVGDFVQEKVDVRVHSKDRIKAAELLGKSNALWTDKQEIDLNQAITFVDDIPLTDDDD